MHFNHIVLHTYSLLPPGVGGWGRFSFGLKSFPTVTSDHLNWWLFCGYRYSHHGHCRHVPCVLQFDETRFSYPLTVCKCCISWASSLLISGEITLEGDDQRCNFRQIHFELFHFKSNWREWVQAFILCGLTNWTDLLSCPTPALTCSYCTMLLLLLSLQQLLLLLPL